MTRISIITICYNNLNELIETIKSVDIQQTLPYEHIIVNGSTEDAIEKYLKNTPQKYYRKWISETDDGIADAFNKGIKMSSGDLIGILNSGDTFYDQNVLKIVHDVFEKDELIEWSNGQLITTRGEIEVVVGKPFEEKKLYRGMRGVFHPTMFLRKEIYTKIGLYNINYKIAMDYDLLCRIKNFKNIFIKYPIVKFDTKGVSSTKYIDSVLESKLIYKNHFGNHWLLEIWNIRLFFLHYLLHTQFGKFLYSIKVKLGLESW